GTVHAEIVVAVLARGKGGEQRPQVLEHFPLAPHHHTVAVLEAPDTPRSAHVHKADAELGEHLSAGYRVAEIGVAPIYDDVTLLQQRDQLPYLLGSRVARGHHDPRRFRLLLQV